MIEINTSKIEEAIKTLCKKSATCLDKNTFMLLQNAYDNEKNSTSKEILGQILQNAYIANKNQRPICQDTGQVIVFLEIGQDVHITGKSLNSAVQNAVCECYTENYFRKSINSSLERKNTNNNTPAIIHSEIVDGEQIKLTVCLKGGGSENMSRSAMLYPAQGMDGIINFVLNTVKIASSKSCPPLVIGIGIGGNLEQSAINSKKALTLNRNRTKTEDEFLQKINALNIGASGKGGNTTAIDLKIIEAPCHIASLPVSISLNCHASRHSSAIIGQKIHYDFEKYEINKITCEDTAKEISTEDIEKIKKLKTGEKILLTGKIYTARDAAHKRLLEDKEKPFEIKNSIIFYAGPCPAAPGETIGPIGPTTSTRMDDYTEELLKEGLIATIGKGERRDDIIKAHQKYGAVYLNATGGVASLLGQCVKNCKLIAYEDLGPEAIYELYVEKMPLFVACGNINEEI